MLGTILLGLLFVLAVLIAGVLLVAARKPDTLRVRRETMIQASPERIFPLINDLGAWRAWSPWEKMDPDMTRNYEGPERGVGAAYEWAGTSKVGAGRMEIVESTPPSQVKIRLHFLKPFESRSVSEFTLERHVPSTLVVWAMHGPNSFLSKVMQVFVNMDRMLGRDFEAGLANLKAVAERHAGEPGPPETGSAPLPAGPQST